MGGGIGGQAIRLGGEPNGNKQIVGKCGKCGGVVSTPTIWHGVNRPPKTCERCKATVDESAHLPVLPMK